MTTVAFSLSVSYITSFESEFNFLRTRHSATLVALPTSVRVQLPGEMFSATLVGSSYMAGSRLAMISSTDTVRDVTAIFPPLGKMEVPYV